MNEIAKNWLNANLKVDNYLAAICDLNGILRGKRVPLSQASKIFKGGVRMPLSICYLDIWGEEIANSTFITDSGDSDGICDWTGRAPMLMDWMPTPAAFVPLWLKNEDGSNFMGDPRCVLSNIVDKFKAKGLTPVVATELEFYLYDATDVKPKPPICPLSGKLLSSNSILTLSELQQFDAFLNDIYAACKAQDIPADTATAENGPGQFEINLLHTDDVLKAADDTILFKEIVRGVAIKHNFAATFMAKPYGDRAGNGMHVHFSLVDKDGNNVFNDDTDMGSEILQNAVAGLLEA
ncbi:MAG: glutamine synthetase, partial [Rhizobiales bacterium]|nr:glutamine synthetase [Hyphomicrobiales bacterium]